MRTRCRTTLRATFALPRPRRPADARHRPRAHRGQPVVHDAARARAARHRRVRVRRALPGLRGVGSSALELFLLLQMLPGSSRRRCVHQYIAGFAEQAARLTGCRSLFIVITAALAIATVEREINLIWGIRRGRSLRGASSSTRSGFTAGPVLLGAQHLDHDVARRQSLGGVPLAHDARRADLLERCRSCSRRRASRCSTSAVPARQVPVARGADRRAARGAARSKLREARLRVVPRAGADVRVVYGALAALPCSCSGSTLLDHRARRRGDQRDARRTGAADRRADRDESRTDRGECGLPNRRRPRYIRTVSRPGSCTTCGPSFKQPAGRSGR